MTDETENEKFSVVKRVRSFDYARRGLTIFFRTTPNAWLQVVVFICVVILGYCFSITSVEWIMLIFAGGFVLTAEAFNTAIEIDMNLTSPEFHPYARDTKDVSAGAVLISSITALIVGFIIFIPYLINFMK